MSVRKIATIVAALLAVAGGYYATTDEPLPFSQTNGTSNVDKARQQLDSLTVETEHDDGGYDRGDWPHWEYVGHGCDAREAVLKRDADQLVPGKGCKVPGGEWMSLYDGEHVDDPSKLDVDHVVALSEAHASGGDAWSEGRREQFANDVRFLVPVSASSNRSKGDGDIAEWLPDNEGYVCRYVTTFVDAKATYSLTVDRAEHDAIADILDRC